VLICAILFLNKVGKSIYIPNTEIIAVVKNNVLKLKCCILVYDFLIKIIRSCGIIQFFIAFLMQIIKGLLLEKIGI
jgi:hypothetical protein